MSNAHAQKSRISDLMWLAFFMAVLVLSVVQSESNVCNSDGSCDSDSELACPLDFLARAALTSSLDFRPEAQGGTVHVFHITAPTGVLTQASHTTEHMVETGARVLELAPKTSPPSSLAMRV